jgi:acetyl-CoA C-acetyltransferase/acetyl-CoA acyltransferase
MTEIFIHDAVRTPRGKGKPSGALASLLPEDLTTACINHLEARGRPVRQHAERLILSSVGQVGAQGGHIAMVAKLHGGLRAEAAAHSLNNFCAGGLSAIGQAAAAAAAGQTTHSLAGGVEMLSRVPFMADAALHYTATNLPPHSRYIPVALAADLLAEAENITRAELDAAALTSQSRASQAPAAMNASVVPMQGLTADETPRTTTAQSLASLPPAFPALAEQYRAVIGDAPIDHRHTLGHAPPLADGAALALIGPADSALPPPRARILAFAESGGDVRASLTAGFTAMQTALARAGLTLDQMSAIEFMEAFAVVIAKFLRDFPVDPARVNIAGGHVARGHPMGATGAVLTATLLDALDHVDGRYGLVVASGAQGVGVAMVVERLC